MKIKSPKLYRDFTPEYKNKLLDQMWEEGLVPPELSPLFKSNNYNIGIQSIEEQEAVFKLRRDYIQKFGYFLFDSDYLGEFKQLYEHTKIVEVGAGSGWLSHNLQKLGVDITPIDIHPLNKNHYRFHSSYTTLLEMDGAEYLATHDYEAALLCWPNYQTDFAEKTLSAMKPGSELIYIGEEMGGCTADMGFFDLLGSKCDYLKEKSERLQRVSKSWPNLNDNTYIYRVR